MAPKKLYWSMDKELTLIDFIEARKFMWDPKDPRFTKSELKSFVYEECAKMLGKEFTASIVKDRWANLRGTFVTNFRKVSSKPGGGAEEAAAKLPTWPLYRRLLFMAPTIRLRGSITNLPNLPCQDLEQTLGSRVIYDSEVDVVSQDIESILPSTSANAEDPLRQRSSENSLTSSLESDHDFHSKRKRRCTREDQQSSNDKLVESITTIFNKHVDRFANFGLLVADQLRNNVEGFNVEIAQLEIQQVIMKYHKDNPENK